MKTTWIAAALMMATALMTGCSGADSSADDEGTTDDAVSAKVIVDFNYGNQITHSYLTVTSGGTVTRREHACCDSADKITKSKLTSSKLKALKAEIAAAASGTESTSKGHATTFGSASGAIIAYTSSGQAVTVYEDARSTKTNGTDTITTNDASEAQSVIDLVNQLTDRNIGADDSAS